MAKADKSAFAVRCFPFRIYQRSAVLLPAGIKMERGISMRYIVTGEQMRKADSYTIEQMGVPSLVLMERAALQVVRVMEQEQINCSRALVVCGSGNNGGDGFAVARLLFLKGCRVDVLFAGNPDNASEENKRQRLIAENYGVSVRNTLEPKEYSVIIDAVFGTGLKRDVSGHYRNMIETLNGMCAAKVSVDIPSGISDTTGAVMGCAFRADLTVCLAFQKLGTILFPGAGYAGKCVTADIGIDRSALPEGPKIYTYQPEDCQKLLPQRPEHSHKGTYGKVLMIAGSCGMAGAAYLNAKAAYCIGAGLVRIYTPEENREILQQLLPEAVITTYRGFDKAQVKELIDWADVVAIGSGLGKSECSERIFTYTMQYTKLPCVIDGDGLSLLAEDLSVLEHKKQIILTPHMKEMSRLLQCSVKQLQENRLLLLKQFTEDYPVVCALKDTRTLVAERDGGLYVNTTGNAAMAKAGAGDVLTGMVSGLLAQGMEQKKACETAVFLHGLCGDCAKAGKGSYSVLASDIIEALGNVLRQPEGIKHENL